MAEGLDATAVMKLSTPVRAVHVDFSYGGSEEFLRDNLPAEDATKVAGARWAIINVWRPLHSPISRDPLAVCDARSVAETDLVDMVAMIPKEATHKVLSRRQDIKGFNLRYNTAHQWYYAPRMTPDEALLIKIFDSEKDGRARLVPHSAFTDPNTNRQDPTRESIEIRCLVSWEHKSTV
jgi:hypothetical protein